MNHKEEDINIDMNSYDDIYYSDSTGASGRTTAPRATGSATEG